MIGGKYIDEFEFMYIIISESKHFVIFMTTTLPVCQMLKAIISGARKTLINAKALNWHHSINKYTFGIILKASVQHNITESLRFVESGNSSLPESSGIIIPLTVMGMAACTSADIMPTVLNQESLKVLLALIKISTICAKCHRDLLCFNCDINKFFWPPPGYISATSSLPSPLPSSATMLSDLINSDGCAHPSCSVKKHVHGSCSRHMCRKHCWLFEGCKIHVLPDGPPSKPHQDPLEATCVSSDTPSAFLEDVKSVSTLEQALCVVNAHSASSAVMQLDAEQQDYMRAVELSLQSNAVSSHENTPLSALPGPSQPRVTGAINATLRPQLTGNPSTELRITTQLNATWMMMHKSDLFQHAQDQCKQDTKATHECRFHERFFLSDQLPLRQWVSECPSWPYWSLDVFNFATMLWEPGYIDHILSLTTQDHVFICVTGMSCISFQDCLNEATSAKAKPHMRTNLTGDCNQFREDIKHSRKGKARELQFPASKDTIILTDSDVEITDSSPVRLSTYLLKRPAPTPDSSDVEFTPVRTPLWKCRHKTTTDDSPIMIKCEPAATDFFALPTGDVNDPINVDAPLAAVINTHPKLLHLSSPSHKVATKALAKTRKNSINNINWEMHPLPLSDCAWPESWIQGYE
ncbi:hypothetical protein C8R48DRAFT_673350 [Suillus tomentosus]|nr:hypothetical protein C8R48DRAFT_673350 [Suillus tomentosus]